MSQNSCNKNMRVAVLLSGGVDSSVALALLKSQGYAVHAFYLKIWLEDELSFLGSCPWQEDLAYVEGVCKKLEVPFSVIPLQDAYREKIVSYVIQQVKSGNTPNPDMLCNTYIKFGAFMECIGEEFTHVATGHYAQVVMENGLATLRMSADEVKDQTYFLARLSQNQLKRALFPIGGMTKEQVRSLAHTFDLPTKNRKDSQGICFLGKIPFREFIRMHVGSKEGALIEYESGALVGKHQGFWFYTIGQRSGIGLSGGPWYVVAKNSKENSVYISRNYFSPEKERTVFTVQEITWLSGKEPLKHKVFVKMRHGKHMIPAQLIYKKDSVIVHLEQRDQAIAPGQFAVFYDNDLCLGSGVMSA